MNRIRVDLERRPGPVDPNLFGGFAEHLGRCIYGGIYDPDSPHADEDGFRTDVLEALGRLRMPVVRYPGGNFASAYRWRDGVGPRDERPARLDPAWNTVEPNAFGTNEFVTWCRRLGAEPYLVVNCGDGDAREARDWVEYCNGTQKTALVQLRHRHGHAEPHGVTYWGIGNEVEGRWQIGAKSPTEYARACTEFAKAMRRVDRDIRIIAAGTCTWGLDFVERARLIIEEAGDLIDYLGVHWYVGNPEDDFAAYMTLSEVFEERLSAYEGLIRAARFASKVERPIHIAVDEWNVMYRKGDAMHHEVYNLEDALVVAMHFNAFVRHAASVRMANLAQIVNVIAPILTRPDGLLRQTIYYPFELYARAAGPEALEVHWDGETFAAGGRTGVRVLDVCGTLAPATRELAVFAVNRSETEAAETEIRLADGRFAGQVRVETVTGPDKKAENSWEEPDRVRTHSRTFEGSDEACGEGGRTVTLTLKPASVTAVVATVT